VKNILNNTDVLILCGGLGKRLGKMTLRVPKPMLLVGDRPFLDIIIDYLADFGCRRFILGTGYKSESIKKYYSAKNRSGLRILFSHETKPLDTGGAVKNAMSLIKSDTFFVLNGDSFCRFDPVKFYSFHKRKKAPVSILLRRVRGNRNEYGEIRVDKSSRVLSFREKSNKKGACLISAGVYLFDKKIKQFIPAKLRFSLERDLFPGMTGRGMYADITSGFFIDIGTPERYRRANAYFMKKIFSN
jgi:NDP-sugar pyrophosphorylase family protein